MYKVEAIRREADEKAWEFEFDGQAYSLPSQVDARVVAAIDSNQFGVAMRLLLGDAQWNRIMEADAILGMTELEGLLRAYFADLGVPLEQRSASGNSLPTTVTP
jgi:hypothetical protein